MTEYEGKKEQRPLGGLLSDLGIDGLLSGLGDFLGHLDEIAKEAEEGTTRFGEIEGRGYKGEYRYSISTIRKGAPPHIGVGVRPHRYERRGYRPSRIEKTKVIKADLSKARESLIDVFDKGDHVLVVAELPLVKEEDIETEIVDNVLKITANTPEGKVERDVSVPEGSEIDRIEEASFKNGILKIKLSKRGGR